MPVLSIALALSAADSIVLLQTKHAALKKVMLLQISIDSIHRVPVNQNPVDAKAAFQIIIWV